MNEAHWGKVGPRAAKGPAKRTAKHKSAKQILYRKELPKTWFQVICPQIWGQIRLDNKVQSELGWSRGVKNLQTEVFAAVRVHGSSLCLYTPAPPWRSRHTPTSLPSKPSRTQMLPLSISS